MAVVRPLRLRTYRYRLTHGCPDRSDTIVEYRNHCVCASSRSHHRSLVSICIFCTSQRSPLSVFARQVVIEHTHSPCHRFPPLESACLYSYLLSHPLPSPMLSILSRFAYALPLVSPYPASHTVILGHHDNVHTRAVARSPHSFTVCCLPSACTLRMDPDTARLLRQLLDSSTVVQLTSSLYPSVPPCSGRGST